MRGDHRVARQRRVPGADPRGDLRVALPAGRQKAPFVAFAPGDDVLVALEHVVVGQPFPFAECDFGEPRLDVVIGRLQAERRPHQFHGRARAHERARHVAQRPRHAAVALEQVAQDAAAADRLRAPFGVERHVVPALQALLHVPVGEAVADIIDNVT